MTHEAGLTKVFDITSNLYITFAEEKRAITWPTDVDRPNENDAEHSFHLAIICGEMAESVGLNPDRVAVKALIHDLVEIRAGDTSVWDEAGLKSKAQREHEAFQELKQEYGENSWMIKNIEEYEARETEEDKFVYAMDKLVAVLMIVEGGGKFWKDNGITFEMHKNMYEQKRKQVAEHPKVLEWYDQLHWHVVANQEVYFDIEFQKVHDQ